MKLRDGAAKVGGYHVTAPVAIRSYERTNLSRRYDTATKEPMFRTLLVVAAVIVGMVVVLFLFYRRITRRDPPGSYDSKPMHPGFRSNRGRGR